MSLDPERTPVIYPVFAWLEIADLAQQARVKGVGPSTLARMWLKERRRQEAQAETTAS